MKSIKLVKKIKLTHENLRIKELFHSIFFNFGPLLLLCLPILSACQPSKKTRSNIIIKDYRVFYDGQAKGYDIIGGSFTKKGDELLGVFIGGPTGDYDTGKRPFLIRSKDSGKTWSEPVLYAEELLINPKEWEKESLRISVWWGPTKNGTSIVRGDQWVEGKKGSGIAKDPEWMDGTLIIGRKEKSSEKWSFKRYPSGTFLGEQFMEGGLQLASGRLIFCIYGAKNKGENWRCGILISDDDGISWRYKDVAYEADLNIRDKPAVVAGFNEQSLFLTAEGKIVSIIRGREKLGRVKDSPGDTWFFRTESKDDGETWSKYEATDIAGTGAAGIGLTLPDGSFLHACRVPYSRKMFKLPEPDLHGLHFARSFDEGKTWQSERIIQRDPAGKPFDNHYNAMNGEFVKVGENEWLYIFGQFHFEEKVFRLLSCRIIVQ